MEEISIYIDFGDVPDFAIQLKERLKKIEGVSQVKEYNDLMPEHKVEGTDYNWEDVTIEAIKNADIVIPVLTEDYLNYLTSNVEAVFVDIIKSNKKFLFPILYKPSDWSSYTWVARSKLIPNDGTALTEKSELETTNLLNGLVKTIKDIVHEMSTKSNDAILIDEKVISEKNIVFISHDHEDADFAELLKLKLEKSGLNAWIDSERLKIGQDWREEIDVGIQNSIAVIAIMTPEARKSEYVTYEWSYAWGKGVKVFPIMLKQTPLHPRLESLQYLDFTNRASRPWDAVIQSLKELIK